MSAGTNDFEINTAVTFNGAPAPLLYVTPTQINAVVPYSITGSTATVVISRFGLSSPPVTVPLKSTTPAIFTATQNGTGQGAILNVLRPSDTLSSNSAANPAPPGSYIEFFATGIGPWTPAVQDGSVNLVATKFITQPVSVTVGGQPASVYYSGSAPYEPWAMMQLIVQLPQNLSSGPQPLVLTVGPNDNSQQKVTVAIQ